jgi:hypothetical protein
MMMKAFMESVGSESLHGPGDAKEDAFGHRRFEILRQALKHHHPRAGVAFYRMLIRSAFTFSVPIPSSSAAALM